MAAVTDILTFSLVLVLNFLLCAVVSYALYRIQLALRSEFKRKQDYTNLRIDLLTKKLSEHGIC
jgi:hypothetical protein